MRDAADTSSPPPSVLARAFLILDCFRSGDRALSATELAKLSALPKSTTHRIVGMLVELGVLERDGGDFSLGLRLFELGGLVPRWRFMREAALPFMEDLFEVTHETVHLGLLDELSVVYLEKIHGHNNFVAASRIGGKLPAHCTGLGKALLAFSSVSTIRSLLSRPLVARTPYTITDPEVLHQQLATVAKENIAYDREEASLGVQCVAAPVLNHRCRAIAALSISAPNTRFEPERLAPAVRTAALGLARALLGRKCF